MEKGRWDGFKDWGAFLWDVVLQLPAIRGHVPRICWSPFWKACGILQLCRERPLSPPWRVYANPSVWRIYSFDSETASAAAWRSCILLFLEARIVRRDAVRIAQFTFETGHSVRLPMAIIRNRALTIGFIFELLRVRHSCPLSERGLRFDLAYAPPVTAAYVMPRLHHVTGRRHQIPAHKRERGGLAKLHSTFS